MELENFNYFKKCLPKRALKSKNVEKAFLAMALFFERQVEVLEQNNPIILVLVTVHPKLLYSPELAISENV